MQMSLECCLSRVAYPPYITAFVLLTAVSVKLRQGGGLSPTISHELQRPACDSFVRQWEGLVGWLEQLTWGAFLQQVEVDLVRCSPRQGELGVSRSRLLHRRKEPESSHYHEDFLVAPSQTHHPAFFLLHRTLARVPGSQLGPSQAGGVQLVQRVVEAVGMAAVPAKVIEIAVYRGASVAKEPGRRLSRCGHLLPLPSLGLQHVQERGDLHLPGVRVNLWKGAHPPRPDIQLVFPGQAAVAVSSSWTVRFLYKKQCLFTILCTGLSRKKEANVALMRRAYLKRRSFWNGLLENVKTQKYQQPFEILRGEGCSTEVNLTLRRLWYQGQPDINPRNQDQ